MSADNGIYYAKFADGYRATYWFAIDNINFYIEGSIGWYLTLREYFWDAQVYQTKNDLLIYLDKLEKKVWWTEYGTIDLWDFSMYPDIFTKKLDMITKEDLEELGFISTWEINNNSYIYELYNDGNPYYMIFFIEAKKIEDDEKIGYTYFTLKKYENTTDNINDDYKQLKVESLDWLKHILQILDWNMLSKIK